MAQLHYHRDRFLTELIVCLAGRDETMQPAKPSFLEYFEQKEKEANSHNDGGRGENNADNRKLPAEGDLQVVSVCETH